MGKFAFCVAGLLVYIAYGVPAAAYSGQKSQRQQQLLQKKKSTVRKAVWHAPQRKAVKSRQRSVTPPVPSEFLTDLDPLGSKFISKTVFFYASNEQLPEGYDCDESQQESKKHEAEMQAIAKCRASGEEHCRVARVVIEKNGALECRDIPGRSCGKRQFFAGCVARALVVGEKEPAASQASIF